MVSSINSYPLDVNTQKFIKLIINENFNFEPFFYSSNNLLNDICRLLENNLSKSLNYIV